MWRGYNPGVWIYDGECQVFDWRDGVGENLANGLVDSPCRRF